MSLQPLSVFSHSVRNIKGQVYFDGYVHLKAGEKMFICSAENIAIYLSNPLGSVVTSKKKWLDLVRAKGADNSCPVSTGIFLRMAIEDVLCLLTIDDSPLPFWRVVDETPPVLKKLGIPPQNITRMRQKEISN